MLEPKRPDKPRSKEQIKKWFVYESSEYKGPLSTLEIQEKLNKDLIHSTDVIWSDELLTWTPIKDVHGLNPSLAKAEPSLDLAPSQRPSMETPASQPISVSELNPPNKLSLSEMVNNEIWSPIKKGFYDYRWQTGVAFLGLISLTQMIEPLRQFFNKKSLSQNPIIKNVSQEEFRELRAAVSEAFDPSSPNLAIGVSNPATREPTFVIATNMPDGARFDIYVRGIPNTLVGRSSFTEQGILTVHRGIASIQALTPFSPGEYQVLIANSLNQTPEIDKLIKDLAPIPVVDSPFTSAAKIFTRKTYFLGGLKNESYERSLEKYHSELRKQASLELIEINQYVDTLEAQLNQSISAFRSLTQGTKNIPKSHISSWNNFNKKWFAFEKKLNTTFTKWTNSWIQENVYYTKLYLLTKRAGELVDQINNEEIAYFQGDLDREKLELKINEKFSLAQSLFLSIRAKTNVMENLLENSKGLPGQ